MEDGLSNRSEEWAEDSREILRDMTDIIEEIEIEDLAVDGICGVY